MTADYDPLTLPRAYFEGLPTGVPNGLPSKPELVPLIVACHSCGNPVHGNHHVWDCDRCGETREFCCECDDAEDTSCRREFEHDYEPAFAAGPSGQ